MNYLPSWYSIGSISLPAPGSHNRRHSASQVFIVRTNVMSAFRRGWTTNAHSLSFQRLSAMRVCCVCELCQESIRASVFVLTISGYMRAPKLDFFFSKVKRQRHKGAIAQIMSGRICLPIFRTRNTQRSLLLKRGQPKHFQARTPKGPCRMSLPAAAKGISALQHHPGFR